jgi:hypothetical protein
VSTPSHRLKLERADKHLDELYELIDPLRGRREYPVVESMERYRNAMVWVYRLDLASVAMSERFPIVFGDYLFNVRSALDHLAVAIAPRKRRHSVSFPIFTEDPLARDERGGDYLHAEKARKWLSITKGLPDECVAQLTTLQPYHPHGLPGERYAPKNHSLTILSALQNADKHRELVPALTGLSQTEATIAGEVSGVVPTLRDGAVLVRAEAKMEVKVESAASVGVGGDDTVWNIDEFLARIGAFVRDEVLPRLEPFLS